MISQNSENREKVLLDNTRDSKTGIIKHHTTGTRSVHSAISERNFVGQTPEIGGVLALKGEANISNRVYYDKFKELLANYVLKELNEPGDVVCAINDMEDPLVRYEKLNNPPGITQEEKQNMDAVDMMILQEKVKDYHKGTKMMVSNMKKMYTYVWGQCTMALQGTIKMEKDYKEKSRNFYTVWILKTIKERL